ncbi:MAG: DMT family transporter [Burkholderiaceae bacterium]
MDAARVTPPGNTATARSEARGLWLGFAGVVMFSLTVPMTKLAVGPADAPELSPWFVTFGRAACAALLSLGYLWLLRRTGQMRLPRGDQWGALALNAAGAVVGFPLFLALALRQVPSTHAAVVTGLLPLATAAIAALWFRQRPSAGFWLSAVAGSALVAAFMGWRAGGLDLHLADLFLVLAMLSASMSYVGGARLTPALGSEQVICWMLVLSLPLTLPLTLWHMPTGAISTSSWMAFAYVSLFSMWIGFFAWFRGLALGGAVRVSQVQLLQPFLSLIFAVPLLGESLDLPTLGFALAVIATVFIGKRMPIHPA